MHNTVICTGYQFQPTSRPSPDTLPRTYEKKPYNSAYINLGNISHSLYMNITKFF